MPIAAALAVLGRVNVVFVSWRGEKQTKSGKGEKGKPRRGRKEKERKGKEGLKQRKCRKRTLGRGGTLDVVQPLQGRLQISILAGGNHLDEAGASTVSWLIADP